MKRRAFTLIEILVVLSIILILAGLLFIGGRRVFGASREKSTRVTLNNLAGMLAEIDAKTQVASQFTGDVVAPFSVEADTYADGNGPAQSLHRYDHPAIIATQAAVGVMRTMPTNKAALDKFAADQILAKPIDPSPGFLLSVDATTGNLNPPVVADAWGNPIIIVPADGMIGVRFADRTGASDFFRVTSKGVVPAADPAPPGSRPFFASAGEDGVFGWIDRNGNGNFDPASPTEQSDVAGGDDNIYSFD